jgi:hypothetical protein
MLQNGMVCRMTSTKTSVLGVDIGRVIIGAADASGRADTSFLSGSDHAALETPPCAGAFQALKNLVVAFNGNVWLVSKCGPRIQRLTLAWLEHQRFYEVTGVNPDRVRFCLKRPEKRDHCAAIGATHFVDDRLDVLEHLVGLVPHLYWFGHQAGEVAPPRFAERVLDWSATERAISLSVPRALAGTRAGRGR